MWELRFGAKHPRRLWRHARSHVTVHSGVILLICVFHFYWSLFGCVFNCQRVWFWQYSPNPKLCFVFSVLLIYSFVVAEQPVARMLPRLKSLCYICVDAIYTVFSICLFVFSLCPLLLFILQILLSSCAVYLPTIVVSWVN
jgi:hypothetical protein